MELSPRISKGDLLKWKQTNQPIIEINDIEINKEEIWSQQQLIQIQSSMKVSVQITMKLNSEFEVSEKIEFEVKEPFEVKSQVLGPPLTYLYLPTTELTPSTEIGDPLSTKTLIKSPNPSLNLPEAQQSYLKVSIKSRADCEMIIKDIKYNSTPESAVQVLSLNVSIIMISILDD